MPISQSQTVLQSAIKSNNPCPDCNDYCLECVRKGKHHNPDPYTLPVRKGKKSHYNSYLRWILRHYSAVERYAKTFYDPADLAEEIAWLLNHPKPTYQLVNGFRVNNSVRVARMVVKIIDPRNYYMSSMVIGKPNSGKTWLGLFAAENAHKYNPDRNYGYFSYTKDITLPPWMDAYTEIPQLPNDLFLIVDEAGIQAPSKRAMKNENVVLGKLMNIRRHKDLQIFFICQEPEDVDRALRRQMDFFFLKPYNLTEVDSKLLQRLYSFIPGGRNPHMCGFYDANEDKGMQLWLPQPRSEEKHKFSKTFSDVDLTAKHSILGNSEGKESDNKVYASFYCHNCGSQWKSNKITVKQKEVEGKTPRQCPRCNSRNWDQPKQQ